MKPGFPYVHIHAALSGIRSVTRFREGKTGQEHNEKFTAFKCTADEGFNTTVSTSVRMTKDMRQTANVVNLVQVCGSLDEPALQHQRMMCWIASEGKYTSSQVST